MRNTESWDAGGADFALLHRALAEIPRYADVTPGDLHPMRVKGLHHAHVLIGGTDAILRIPRLSSFGFAPADNLVYQAACFDRAAPSRHVPALLGILPPQAGIPWGALIVSRVDGGTPPVPAGMGAIAQALAALHGLRVPSQHARPPLPSHADPVAATLEVIEAQAAFLDDAGLAPAARRQIDDELDHARRFASDAAGQDMPITLAGTDTHPGNFMMQPDGKAVFVDLEKMLYGSPAIDLAHATVYTSTMWDADVATALSREDVAAFYDAYFEAVPEPLGNRIRPWCGPLRRFTWLRTTTWCAKLRVLSRNGAAWSGAQRDPEYMAAVRQRVDDYFDPETISRIRAGFEDN
jgi:aminoglycoside phosphotransferase (APT) family kinase protein